MRRRNFLKSCLGSLCLPVIAAAKSKPKTKEIKMYTSSSKTKRPGVDRLNWIRVKYTGKEKVHAGNVLVWQEDGTVRKPNFAGVAK